MFKTGTTKDKPVTVEGVPVSVGGQEANKLDVILSPVTTNTYKAGRGNSGGCLNTNKANSFADTHSSMQIKMR